MDGGQIHNFGLEADIRAASVWEEEVYRTLARSRARAWAVATASLMLALLSVSALVIALPFKTFEPYVVTVDRQTGAAEIASVVDDAALQADEVLTQSYIVEYLVARESFDAADNEGRMHLVHDRSVGLARQSWRQLWDYSNVNHPEKLYGDAQIAVHVKSVSFLDDQSASVRFSKTLREAGRTPVVEDFVAIIGFRYVRRPGAIDELWRNPLGFEVASYRVDQENIAREREKS